MESLFRNSAWGGKQQTNAQIDFYFQKSVNLHGSFLPSFKYFCSLNPERDLLSHRFEYNESRNRQEPVSDVTRGHHKLPPNLGCIKSLETRTGEAAEHFCASRKWVGDLRRNFGPPAVIISAADVPPVRLAPSSLVWFRGRGQIHIFSFPELQGVFRMMMIYGADLAPRNGFCRWCLWRPPSHLNMPKIVGRTTSTN